MATAKNSRSNTPYKSPPNTILYPLVLFVLISFANYDPFCSSAKERERVIWQKLKMGICFGSPARHPHPNTSTRSILGNKLLLKLNQSKQKGSQKRWKLSLNSQRKMGSFSSSMFIFLSFFLCIQSSKVKIHIWFLHTFIVIGASETQSRNRVSQTSSSTGRSQFSHLSEATSSTLSPRVDDDNQSTDGQILETSNLRVFSFADMKSATKNFKSDQILGEGGFGRVFKGWVDEKTLQPSRASTGMMVAVKKLNPESMQGFQEWQVIFFNSKMHYWAILIIPD